MSVAEFRRLFRRTKLENFELLVSTRYGSATLTAYNDHSDAFVIHIDKDEELLTSGLAR